MSKVHIEESRVINAPPHQVYALLADYRVGHPSILPKPYFDDYQLEQGGEGVGTVVRVTLRVMGTETKFRLVVTEAEPGKLIKEADPDAGTETVFTFTPSGDGSQTLLTIATDFTPTTGLRGLLERLMNPPITRRIYREQLGLIADRFASPPAQT